MDEDISDEFLLKYYPSTLKADLTRKEFRHPRTLLEMQHSYHKGAPLYENEAKNILMLGSRDTGKALKADTYIPTVHQGFVQIKDLTIGTEIFSLDGTPTKVTGVFPQGKLKLNRLKFRDGRYIFSCNDHL